MAAPSVIALVAAYNEADVVGHVVRDLIEQGVSVYFMDDGSTDGTVAAVEPLVGRGVLAIEPLGDRGSTARRFEWTRILERKAQLAHDLDADWFIHHDADEFRESPWRGMTLAEAIGVVDRCGFNAIDALSLDFWPTHDRFQPGSDPRAAFTGYLPAAPHDRRQIRCWKKTAAVVDLASSGGHDVQFPNRRVFPIRFLLRHYPIRGTAHGEQKVLRERLPRFSPEESARGWHVQYHADGSSFLRDPSSLTPYDADAIRVQLTLEHRGVEELRAAREADQLEITGLRRQLDELEAARQREAAAVQQLQKAYEAVNARERDLAGHRAALDHATQRLRDVEQSWSWRLTAAGRAVFRLLSGRAS